MARSSEHVRQQPLRLCLIAVSSLNHQVEWKLPIPPCGTERERESRQSLSRDRPRNTHPIQHVRRFASVVALESVDENTVEVVCGACICDGLLYTHTPPCKRRHTYTVWISQGGVGMAHASVACTPCLWSVHPSL